MNTELSFPDVAETDDPFPRTGAELPCDIERLRALADSLDCVLPDDLCALAGVKRSTPEAWAKRGEGPDYVMFGNRRLYPRDALRKFLSDRQRTRRANAGSLL